MMSYLTQYSPLFLRDLERIWTEVFSVSQNLITSNQYINDLMDKIEKYNQFIPKLSCVGSPCRIIYTVCGFAVLATFGLN